MKKQIHHHTFSLTALTLLSLAYFSFSTAPLQAADVDGKILTSKGDLKIILPGATKPIPAKKGQTVPAGSRLITSPGSSAIVGLTAGAATIIQPGSDVSIKKLSFAKKGSKTADRKILLDVKRGSLISMLKPRDGKTDFSIKTPKGVAAARGTVWSIDLGSSGTSLSMGVIEGTVSLALPGGGSVTIPVGTGVTVGADGTTAQGDLSDAQVTAIVNALKSAGATVTGTLEGGFTISIDGFGDITFNPATTSEISPIR